MANWWEEAPLAETNWWEAAPVVGEDEDDPNWAEGMWSGIVGQTAKGVAGTTEAAQSQAEEYATQPYAHQRFGRSNIAAGFMGQRGGERDESLRPEIDTADGFIASMRGLAEEKLEIAEKGRPENYAGQVLYDAGTALGVMLPSLATGMLTKNPNAALAMMGIPAFGAEYEDALERGYSHERAMVDGWVAVATELGPEKLFGVWDNVLGAKGAKDLFFTSMREGGSEMTTETLNMIYEGIRGESELEGVGDAVKRVFHAGLVGAVLGGGLGAGPAASNRIQENRETRRQQGMEWEQARAAQESRDEQILGEQIGPTTPMEATTRFTQDWLGQPVVEPTRIEGLETEQDILSQIEARTTQINETINAATPDYQQRLDMEREDQDRLRRQRLRAEMGEDFDPSAPATVFDKQDEFQFTMPVDPVEIGSDQRAPYQPPTAEEVDAGLEYRMKLEDIANMDEIDIVRTMPPHRQDQYFETTSATEAQQMVTNQREILTEEAAEQRAGRGVLRISRQELYDARNEEEATRLEDDRQAANLWDYKAENRSWNKNITTALQIGEQLSKEELVRYHKRAGEQGKWEVLGIDPESMMARVKWTQKRKQGDGEVEFTWKIGEPDSWHVVRTDAGVQSRVNSTKTKPPNELIRQVDKVGAALILTGGDAARFPSRGTSKGVKRDVPFIGAPRAKALVDLLYQELVKDYRGSLAPKGRLVAGKESREKADPKVLDELYDEAKRLASRNISSVEKAVRTGTFVGVDAPKLVQVPGQHTFEQDMGQVVTLMEKGAKQRLNSGETVLEKAYQVMVDGSIREIEITANADGTGYEMTPIAQGLNRFTGKVPTEPFGAGKPNKRWINQQRNLGRGATVEDIVNNEKIERANELKRLDDVRKRQLSQAQKEERQGPEPESAAEYARRREEQKSPEEKRAEEKAASLRDEDAELYNLAREQEAELASERAREGVSPEEGTVPLTEIQKAEEEAARERPVGSEERVLGRGPNREKDLGLENRLREAAQDTFYNFKSTPRTEQESLARAELEKALDAITPYVQSITAPGSQTYPSAVGRLQRARVRRALIDVIRAVEAAGPQGAGDAKMILSAPLDMPKTWGHLVEAMKRLVASDKTLTAEQKELMDNIIVETYAQNVLDEHGRVVATARDAAELSTANRQLLDALAEIRALPSAPARGTTEGMTAPVTQTLKDEHGKNRRITKGKRMAPDVAAAYLMQFEGMTPQRALSVVEEAYDMQLGKELLLKLEEQAKKERSVIDVNRPADTRVPGEIVGQRTAAEATQWDIDRPAIEIAQEDLRAAATEAVRTTGLRAQLIEAGYRRPRLDPRYETGEESRARQRRKVEQIKRRKEERALAEKEQKVRELQEANRKAEYQRMVDMERAAEQRRRELEQTKFIPLPRIEMGQAFEEQQARNYVADPQQLELVLPEGKGPKKTVKKGETKAKRKMTPNEWTLELSAKKEKLVAPEGLHDTLAERFKFDKKTMQAVPVSQTRGKRKKSDFTHREQQYRRMANMEQQKAKFDAAMEKFYSINVVRNALDFQTKFDVQPANMTGASAMPSSRAVQIQATQTIIADRTDPLGRSIFTNALAKNWLGRKVMRYLGGKTSSLVGSQKNLQQEHMRLTGLVSTATTRYEDAWAKALTILKAETDFNPDMKVGDEKPHAMAIVAYLDDMTIAEVEKEYGLRIPDAAAEALNDVKVFGNYIARKGLEYGAFASESTRHAIEAGHGYTHKSLQRSEMKEGRINKRMDNVREVLYQEARRAWGLNRNPHDMTREEMLDMILSRRHNVWRRHISKTASGNYLFRHVDATGRLMEVPLGPATNVAGNDVDLSRSTFKNLKDHELRAMVYHAMPKPNSPTGDQMEGVINQMVLDITGVDLSGGALTQGLGADTGIQEHREFLLPDREYNNKYAEALKGRASRLKIGEQFQGWLAANGKEMQGWSTNTFVDRVGAEFPQLKDYAEQLRSDMRVNKMLRTIVGEMTDPESILADTMGKLSTAVGTSAFLNSTLEQGLAAGWATLDNPPRGWVPLAPRNSRLGRTTFSIKGQLDEEPFLKGHNIYVKPEVAEAVKDMFVIHEKGDKTFEAAYKLSGLSKYMVVVASPLAHARNFASTGVIHVARAAAGSNAGLAYTLGTKMFVQQARGGVSYKQRAKSLEGYDPRAKKVFDWMLNAGMLFDGGKSGALYDLNREDGIITVGKTPSTTKVGRGGARVKYFADNMFRLEDEAVKGIGFIMHTSEYLDFVHGRKDLFEKWVNDETLTAEEQAMINEALEAGKETTLDKYPTFSRVAGGVKTISRLPVIGAFPSFSYEVMRTSLHAAMMDGNMMLGRVRKADGSYTKIKHNSAKAKLLAATRLAGNAAMWGAAPAASYLLTAAAMEAAGQFFDDDEDEAEGVMSGLIHDLGGHNAPRAKLKDALPWWQRSQVNAITDIDRKNHTMTVTSVDYMAPTGGILNGLAYGLEMMAKEAAKGNEVGVGAWMKVLGRTANEVFLGDEVFLSTMMERFGTDQKEKTFETTGALESAANKIDNFIKYEIFGGSAAGEFIGGVAGAATEQLAFPMIVSNAEDLSEYIQEVALGDESLVYGERSALEMLGSAVAHLGGLKKSIVTPEKWGRTAASDVLNYKNATTELKRSLLEAESYEEALELVKAHDGMRRYLFQTVHNSLHIANQSLGLSVEELSEEMYKNKALRGTTGDTLPSEFWRGDYFPVSNKAVFDYMVGQARDNKIDPDVGQERYEWYVQAKQELEPESISYGDE